MIGELHTKNKQVAIVGGGAAGAFAAYYLDKHGYDVTLFEASQRLGGLIRTTSTEHGLVEGAANSLISSPALQVMANDLGVRLDEVHPNSRAKYILYKGKPRRNPLGPFELAQVLYSAFLKRAPVTANNMREFAETQFGPKVADYLVEPMITGIYGAKAEEVAVAAAFPRLRTPKGMTPYQAMKRNAKVFGKAGKRNIVAPAGGMEQLFTALSHHLERRLGSRLRLNEPLDALPDYPNLVICTPAAEAAKLVRPDSSLLSSRLNKVLYTPMVTVGVFVRNECLNVVPKGLGVLIPPKEQRQVLGILYTSSSFPGRVVDPNVSLLTFLMGGSQHPHLLAESDEGLEEIITATLQDLFGFKGKPLQIVVKRWPGAIPAYSQNLLQVWQTARETWCAQPGRVLFGNYTGEVSLRGMLDNSAKLAQNLPIPVKTVLSA